MTDSQPAPKKVGLTPELVEKVTERVYRLLLQEARLERERAWLNGRHGMRTKTRG